MQSRAGQIVEAPRLLTAEEVAEMLGLDVARVWKLSRRGEIPTITIGRSRRYRREAILRWLEEIESQPAR
jgi:excisionase family DNA binding protein